MGVDTNGHNMYALDGSVNLENGYNPFRHMGYWSIVGLIVVFVSVAIN